MFIPQLIVPMARSNAWRTRLQNFTHLGKHLAAASAIAGFSLLAAQPAWSATTLSIKPIAWDVIGLDSNKPSTDGPTDFPLAVRVKNTGAETANNLSVLVKLEAGGNTHVKLVGLNPITSSSLAAGQVADFYFNLRIDRPPGDTNAQTAGYFSVLGNAATTKKYTVEASATNAPVVSTPTNRQLFVEKILSQNRNSVDPVLIVDHPEIPFLAGQVRMFTLFSDTATGYDQQETGINFPTQVFQILSVKAIYTDPPCGCIITNETQFVEPLVPTAGKFTTNKGYVDGCGWVNDFNDPDYHTSNDSCTNDSSLQDSPTGKIGGTIVTTYMVKVVSNIVDPVILSYLVHDHSGSSFHYNFDDNIFEIIPTNILVGKTAPSQPVAAGTDFSYMITVQNDSDTAADDVILSDTLPSCVTIKSANPAPVNLNGNPLEWHLGTLQPGGSKTFEVVATSKCSVGPCENTATVSTSDFETNYDDNISTAEVTIADNTPPGIICPADKTLECPADLTEATNGTATGTDLCGVTITHSDSFVPACGNTGVLTRTFTATDDNGNQSTCNQTLTVVDTTSPTISDVPDATVECTGNTEPGATGTPTASDSCGTVAVTHTDGPMSNGCGNTGSFVRTWKATDQCGNTRFSEQTITVVDTTKPTIGDLPDRTVECTESTAAGDPPSASDTCGTVVVTHTDGTMSNGCGNTGSFVRTWKATDECGNFATSEQTITVVDTTKPTIGDLPDRTVECTESTAAGDPPSASDTCGTVVVTHTDGTMSNGCGNTGSFVRTWKATDECGNFATSEQTITVVDTTKPTIGDLPDKTVECTESTAAGDPPSASDTCGTVAVTHTDGTMSNGCGNTGSFVRTWKATDECGNFATSEQTITVVDTTPPTVTCPANISAPAPSGSDTCTVVTYSATASDTCGNVTITYDPPSGTCFACGTTSTVLVTATDECGNQATCTFTVTVADCVQAGCGLTQGYWKNHPNAWPVTGLTLGNRFYTKAECLKILNKPVKGNGLIALAHQLIAAKLNVGTGASSSCIATAIAQADALIGNKVIPPIGNGKLTTSAASALNNLLDDYNNGRLCVRHCDSTEPKPISEKIY